MENTKSHAEIRKLILKGIKLSFVRLVKEAASEGRELIIAKDGKPVKISAKELMKWHGIKE